MVELVRHRQTKGAATDMFEPTATAPHLDSTDSGLSRLSLALIWLTVSKGWTLAIRPRSKKDLELTTMVN